MAPRYSLYSYIYAFFPFVVDRDTAFCPCTIHPTEASPKESISTVPHYSLDVACQEILIQNPKFPVAYVRQRTNCII
jgi:hypothetical protein